MPGPTADGSTGARRRAGRHWSAPARRALVASISSRVSTPAALASLVAACDQGELVQLAISEGVFGRVNETLGHLLLPSHRARLRAEVRHETLRHLAYLDLLGKFGAALDEAEVTWAVLKGPVLTELAYGGACRGYSDLDLLVPAPELRRAVQALESVGAALADRNWSQLVREAKGELCMSIFGTPLIDLHWHLIYLRSARQRFTVPTDEILERRQRVQLATIGAWALEPTDFAIHLALHASLDGAQRLRRLLDIERTLATRPPIWDVLVQRCHAWRVGLPVGVLLNRARATLGAAVPEEVIRSLAGGPIERLMVDRLEGWVPYAPGRWSVQSGVTRSLRDGLVPTGVEFVGRAWQILHGLVRPGLTEPADPSSSLSDAARPPGFERFLEMVDRADRCGHLDRRELRSRGIAAPTGEAR